MSERLRTVLIAAAGGAIFSAAAVTIAYAARPSLNLEMDRSLPRRLASGFYDTERSGQSTFAWTSQRADIKLAGLNRRVPWACAIRLRGGRADPATQPIVALAVDGITVSQVKATNDFQDAPLVVPKGPSSGATISLTSSSTLVPGPSDPRPLGIQVDRMTCAPQGAVWPPSAIIRDAALTGLIFGAAFALVGLTRRIALAAVLTLGTLQALPLASGPAPYDVPFSETMVWFAIWISVATIAVVAMLDRLRPAVLADSARLAIVVSAAVLYLKLLGLSHPSKLPIDAVFHAHRFEWVLAGKYYFTQGMPGGVAFPYAIGLYVFAAPWSLLTHDHVTLLRVVVCSVQAIAGTLLYSMIVQAWNDRIAGVIGVVLFNVVPLPFGLLGNANLTNTFGEAVAVVAVVSASFLLGARALPLVGVFCLTTLAFLSHVSTFALLGATLVALSALYRAFGGPSLRQSAGAIGSVTILSAIVAVVLYWGHFGDVYKNALHVRGNAGASAVQVGPAPASDAVPAQNSVVTRISGAITFGVGVIGWPIILLALVGLWRSVVDGGRDRASLAALAWGAACVVFLGVAAMRVDAPFQRYAAEFFGRVLLATFPAAVLLAARGTGWAWRDGAAARFASAMLVICAVFFGFQSWSAWFL